MIKKTNLTLLAILFSISGWAQQVDLSTARTIATNYMNQMRTNGAIISASHTQLHNGVAAYYIFNFENGGFVMVSADKKTTPVLAYSTSNNFDFQMKNPALKQWMQGYEESITERAASTQEADLAIRKDWENLKEGKPLFTRKSGEEVAPLLTCTWNQDKYYNTCCPADDKVGNGDIAGTEAYDCHVPVGCVALSAAQIMYYYRYPETGIGSSSYSSAYGKLTANYGNAHYDYNAMADVATGYSYSIAQLIYHIGVSLEMGYGADGSGTQTKNLINSMRKRFGYSSSIQYSERKNYTNENWHALLKSNLDKGMPMVYSGSPLDGGSGHAFNCDGYDQTGKFHMNWGWGGSSNGYYDIDNMTRVGEYDLSGNHQVVCNIKPQNFTPKANDTLTATYGSFGAGNSAIPYTSGTKRTWLICPPNATSITLTVSTFDTDTSDIVAVYSDPTQTTPIATFKGQMTDVQNTLKITGGTAYITFTANNDDMNGSGFLFNYTTELNDLNYCNTTEILSNTYRINSTSGTIDNGSNGKNYADANACYWRIEPQGANAMWIKFSKFDLEDGDELTLFNYKAANTINPSIIKSLTYVVATYTKNNPPELDKLIELEKSGLYLRFRSDNNLAGKGWAFDYGINVGVEESKAGLTTMQVYPNPANGQVKVNITFAKETEGQAEIRLNDLMGRTVYSTSITAQENASLSIPTSELAAGIYFMNIRTAKGTLSRKLQVVH
ncbi:MAG: C10 family peptidase [Bacteroidales bacterium]|nr:C10 family peptidase [Bacteroidales bacterium]